MRGVQVAHHRGGPLRHGYQNGVAGAQLLPAAAVKAAVGAAAAVHGHLKAQRRESVFVGGVGWGVGGGWGEGKQALRGRQSAAWSVEGNAVCKSP